jgi:hypothetical protein
MSASSKQLDEALLTLAWSLWTEIGVAGVERHHRDIAVDPTCQSPGSRACSPAPSAPPQRTSPLTQRRSTARARAASSSL